MFARRLHPEQRELLRVLAYAYLQHGHAERALPLLRLLCQVDPLDRQAQETLACSLIRMRRAQEALEVLETMTQRHEASALTWLLRGQALALLGRMREAAGHMKRFVAERAAIVAAAASAGALP
jgi:predicted Zn-dependent protease